jgi:hypothetical protein
VTNSFTYRVDFSLPTGAKVFDSLGVDYIEHVGFSQ